MESFKETYDYDLFKFGAWNRDIKQKNLKKLEKCVKAEGWKKHPIIVNENMEVIDGQHRLVYAKSNNLPVYYIVIDGLTSDDCVDMNNIRTAWSAEDFIKLFASQGNESYIRLQAILRKYSFAPTSTIVGLLKSQTVSGNLTQVIRAGKFKLTATEAKDIENKFDFMQEIAPYVKAVKGRSASIFSAISFCYALDSVDNSRLKKQIKNRIANITPPVDMEMALKEVEYVYNYKILQGDYVDIFTEYKRQQRARLQKQAEHLTQTNLERYGTKNGRKLNV